MIGLLPSLIFLGGYGWGGGQSSPKEQKREGGHKNLLLINCQGREDHKNII